MHFKCGEGVPALALLILINSVSHWVFLLQKKIRKQPVSVDIIICISLLFTLTAILATRRTIQQLTSEIASAINDINDQSTLDRVMTLLTQAQVSITATTSSQKGIQFGKERSICTNKENKTQLHFKQTMAIKVWQKEAVFASMVYRINIMFNYILLCSLFQCTKQRTTTTVNVEWHD